MAAPATARAVDTVGYTQPVLTYTRTFSVVATPEAAQLAVSAVELSKSAEAGAHDQAPEESDGDSRIPLSRNHPYVSYQDGNFTHSARWNPSYSNINWGVKMSAAWQSAATSPVTENSYWLVNGERRGTSHHVQHASYHFHGTFPSVKPGDAVDFVSQYTFECGPDTTCVGTLFAGYYIVD